ncbi:MAG: HEAT repeat domain-containing protein [Chlorobiaceae bacterium]|nr:HEAT repeat domain-containing protein [Chlorobiaceae bacterium]
MKIFLLFAYAIVLLTGIVILLSIALVLVNNLTIRREAKIQEQRKNLRLSLLSYVKGDIRWPALKIIISGQEKLLVGLVAQLAEELGESARLKCIELFSFKELNKLANLELKKLSHSLNWRKRQRAATFLPYIANSQANIPPLVHALEDKVFMVRFSAAHSLATIKAIDTIIPILEHLSLPSEWPIERTIEIIYEMGREAISPLMNYLSLPTAKNESKVFAISALGLLHVGEAVPFILTYLCNPDKELRIQSAKALGNIGATEATVALCNSMNDSAWEVKATSANALGLLKNKSSIPILLGGLRDSAWWVRYNSANALAELGNEGITALKEAYSHDDKFAREVSRLVLQERSLINSDQERVAS